MVDVHSHILPALDDGSRCMEQSLKMLRIACEEGIRAMIATPHNMPGKGSADRETVEDSLAELRDEAAKSGIFLKLFPGMEYFFRQEVLDILEKGEGITLAGTDCVLVEFDPYEEKKYIRNAVRDILALEYIPVLAHVERYAGLMEKDREAVRELRAMGALIQVNCGSVTGDFGRAAKRDTRALLKEGLVDLVGTDAHSDGHRAPRMRECAAYIRRKYGEGYARALLSAKALQIEF